MLSVGQSYSRLFRPWDVTDVSDKTCDNNNKTIIETKPKRRMAEETKRENRLRKIRGTFRKTEDKTNIHQDATVSTTTEDGDDKKLNNSVLKMETDSPVASLTLCCDRLLEEPQKTIEKEIKAKEIPKPMQDYPPVQIPANIYPPYVPEYLPAADIAQALGVPSTDPLLLESLAQGYAMELEYARIIQQENEAKLLNARKQRPKKYKCPHCHVGFSNNGQLKGHIRIHTGERPYKCDEKNCGKSFTRNEELTRHKRIHSGVRPFPCPTCGKKFGRRDHLKKHTRTHFLQAERMMPVFVPLSAIPHVGAFPYLYGY